MTPSHTPRQNLILAALTVEDYGRLRPDLELTPLPLGSALSEPGRKTGYIFFPTTSMVSFVLVTESGDTTETAVIGNEGLVGASFFLGGDNTAGRTVVQSAGFAYRMRASILKTEFALGAVFQCLALRFTQALITQIAQTAVCNRHHPLDQQLCRRLLLSLDRSPGNDLTMTQEQIANLLGVRRESVTEAARQLQASGLIRYKRGHITVLNRAGLEARVCECYAVVKKELDRLLPYDVFMGARHR